MEALRTSFDIELHLLSLGKALETVHLDSGEVYEDIFAGILLDEAVTLGVIEPFDLPLSHASSLLRGKSILHKYGAGRTGVVCEAYIARIGNRCQEKPM
jgi:hypothetical protein